MAVVESSISTQPALRNHVKAGQESENGLCLCTWIWPLLWRIRRRILQLAVSYVDFYPKGVEPWEPNVTRTNTKENLKWHNFISLDTPVPTPWQKTKYDSIETLRGNLDRLASDYYEKREGLLKSFKRNSKKSSMEWNRRRIWRFRIHVRKTMYRPL